MLSIPVALSAAKVRIFCCSTPTNPYCCEQATETQWSQNWQKQKAAVVQQIKQPEKSLWDLKSLLAEGGRTEWPDRAICLSGCTASVLQQARQWSELSKIAEAATFCFFSTGESLITVRLLNFVYALLAFVLATSLDIPPAWFGRALTENFKKKSFRANFYEIFEQVLGYPIAFPVFCLIIQHNSVIIVHTAQKYTISSDFVKSNHFFRAIHLKYCKK